MNGNVVYCSKCNGETKFIKGVSKKGNPYQGFKCLEPDCENVDWVRDEPTATKIVKETISLPPKLDKIRVDLATSSMLMSYCKDLVCAQIQSDKYSEPLGIEDVIKNYEKMKQAL